MSDLAVVSWDYGVRVWAEGSEITVGHFRLQ